MKKPRHIKAVPANQLPKGPNGRNLCRECKTEVPASRKTFCSDNCSHEWGIRCSASYARSQVYIRDQGVCRLCHVDTDQLARVCQKLMRRDVDRKSLQKEYDQYLHSVPFGEFSKGRRLKPLSLQARDRQRLQKISNKYPWLIKFWDNRTMRFRISLWQMDHIIAVDHGGGACGMENLRTLCIACHHQVTARQAANRSKRKRIQRVERRTLVKGRPTIVD